MTDGIRKEFDVRVVDFHLRRRSVTHEEYEKYLASLPDDAEEADETETTFESTYGRNNPES